MPVHDDTMRGDVVGVDLFLEQAAARRVLGQRGFLLGELLLELGLACRT